MKTTNKQGARGGVGAIARELDRENKPTSPVVQALNLQVANAFVLYANYKHYHWQTYGPLFRDLHRLFDELAGAVIGSVDELAERVRMIGQDPPAHLTRLADLATTAVAAPDGSIRDMIEEANRNSLIVIREMRQAARVADEHDDPGTVDLFSKLVQVHEKQEWWLRDILRSGDGLTSPDRGGNR
jgi:starvation-inducible DNA-binding protein